MRVIYCLIFLLTLVSCGQESDSNGLTVAAPRDSSETADFIEKGDLDAILERGVIRFVAPRYDGADALPRDGIPVAVYQELAEAFALEKGLSARWVFVDTFEELLPALNNGYGDVVITNMTVTESRKEKVRFTNPINKTSEVVVARTSLSTVEEISSVSVPAGTVYKESVKKAFGEEFPVFEINSKYSDTDVLSMIDSGEVFASVFDANVVDLLLLDYPHLNKGLVVNQNRAIAWAVRKQAAKLQDSLNRFLVSHHVRASHQYASKRSWAEIKKSGKLRMLTLNNPASYFIWKGELMGFDYDLMKKFASDHGLHLSVTLKDSIEELLEALKKGEGDVAAASITRTDERESRGLVFSRPYLKLNEQILYRDPSIKTLSDLAGKKLGVNPETSYMVTLASLGESVAGIELVEYPGLVTEEVIGKVEAGEIDFTIADGHLAKIELAHSDTLKSMEYSLSESNIGWVLRDSQAEFLTVANAFLQKEYKGLYYNIKFNKYFKNKREMKVHEKDRIVKGTALSEYDDLVKRVASKYGFDWRLVIAQMYQESKFKPGARSFAGAQGLMQVMPRTGKEFGYTDLQDPEEGIEAGVVYLSWLRDRFPEDLEVSERTFFMLASYNAGAGHVRDARKLARTLGLNPDKWFGNTEKAMLLLSKPEYYKKARFGYVRGKEPVAYVREIRQRYLSYLN